MHKYLYQILRRAQNLIASLTTKSPSKRFFTEGVQDFSSTNPDNLQNRSIGASTRCKYSMETVHLNRIISNLHLQILFDKRIHYLPSINLRSSSYNTSLDITLLIQRSSCSSENILNTLSSDRLLPLLQLKKSPSANLAVGSLVIARIGDILAGKNQLSPLRSR